MQEELYEFVVPHPRGGRVALHETAVTGFDRIAEAFLGMPRGENLGKMIVRATDAV